MLLHTRISTRRRRWPTPIADAGARMTRTDQMAEALVALGFAAARSPCPRWRLHTASRCSRRGLSGPPGAGHPRAFRHSVRIHGRHTGGLCSSALRTTGRARAAGCRLAFALSSPDRRVRGRSHPSRMLLAVGNSVFALGPAAVFALAHTDPARASLTLLLLAPGGPVRRRFQRLLAPLAIAREADLASQLRDYWIYGSTPRCPASDSRSLRTCSARPAIELVVAPFSGCWPCLPGSAATD